MIKIAVAGIRDAWSSKKLTSAVKNMTGFSLLFETDEVTLDLESGEAFIGVTPVRELDAIIIKKIGSQYSRDFLDRLDVLAHLEKAGTPVFSSPLKIAKLVSRLDCTLELRRGKIPMPPTTVTGSIDEALDALERYGKAVFKPIYTSKARGMKLIEAGPKAREEIEAFRKENPLMYVQKKIDINCKDLGVAFLGGEYLTTYARCSDGSCWKTTTHFGGEYMAYEPSEEIIRLAEKAQALFGLDFTCVDVAETTDGPVVFEVSAFGGFRGIVETSKIDPADLYVKHVLKRLGK